MLKTKQVGVYTVSQIGALQGANLRIFQKRISELISNNDDPAYAEALNEWAVVAACTSPYIPLEAWLETPLMELRPVSEAVEELNSDISAEETPKKKPPKAQR